MDQIQQTPAMPSKLAAAFVKAQALFTEATKNATNPEFGSSYANLDAVFDAIKKGLQDNKIAVIQRGIPAVGQAAIETILVHESGETYSCGIMQAPVARNDPQGFGSAITYLRRYALKSACGVSDSDDDGNAAMAGVTQQVAASEATPATPGAPGSAHAENVKAIKAALEAAGSNEIKMLHWLKSQAKVLNDITPAEALRASKSLGITLPVDESGVQAVPAQQAEKTEQVDQAPVAASGGASVSNF